MDSRLINHLAYLEMYLSKTSSSKLVGSKVPFLIDLREKSKIW